MRVSTGGVPDRVAVGVGELVALGVWVAVGVPASESGPGWVPHTTPTPPSAGGHRDLHSRLQRQTQSSSTTLYLWNGIRCDWHAQKNTKKYAAFSQMAQNRTPAAGMEEVRRGV